MENKAFQSFIVGLIAVQLFIKFLKKVIKQKRPDGAKSKDYGMPSRRAGITLFTISFLLLSIKNIYPTSIIISIIFIVGSLGLKFFQHEHSILQLLVGSIIGVIFGYAFYSLSQYN
jgi:membrane-associated phospholipid phosphatase